MNNFIKFTDAITGHAHLADGISGKKYIKTKDSTSKSGHSLYANIEMTHSGIVTRNLGFYMPDSMKGGAHTFNKNYNKPVIIGHDDDSDPVGRVVDANYIDTSNEIRINDKYLASMFEFVDKKKKNSGKQELTDFVQYVIQEYSHKDNYRGMGHILGTLKIDDEETIAKILDERYLTVSTSMISDAARCSECGQDWISEGQCDHDRGQIYDSGVPVVLVPGSQSYNHLGIVTEPADVFAAGFKGVELVKDGIIKNLMNDNDLAFTDKFSIAADLFSYKDSKLISLSDKKETDLIEVKNNIQRIEDSLNKMENVVMTGKEYADQIEATISLWSNEEGETTSVRVSKYVKELSADDVAELSKKAMAALDSAEFESESQFKDALLAFVEEQVPAEENTGKEPVQDSQDDNSPSVLKVKVLNDKFKLIDGEEYLAELEDKALESILNVEDADLTKREAKELAKLIVRSEHKDAIASLTITPAEKLEDSVAAFKELKDKRFTLKDATPEEVVSKMNELLEDDHKISEEAFVALDAKTCAGSGKYFPITSRETADAAKVVLGTLKASDSIRGRVLGMIEKLSTDFEATKDSATSSAESFDTSESGCDNQVDLSDEKVLEDLKGLVELADERGLLEEVIAPQLEEKQQEIEIVEQMLDLANDEVDKLKEELKGFADTAKLQLAEKVVDAKIGSGLIEDSNREEEVAKHLERTEDSLKDAAADFAGFKVEGTPSKKTEELEQVNDPTLDDSATSADDQFNDETEAANKALDDRKKKDLQKKYQLLRAQKGKAFADNWLKQKA